MIHAVYTQRRENDEKRLFFGEKARARLLKKSWKIKKLAKINRGAP